MGHGMQPRRETTGPWEEMAVGADAGRAQWSKPAATRHLAVYRPLEDQAVAPGALSTDHRA